MSEDDSSANLAVTPLYALHQELGARLVPFAGYSMPVQYPRGIIQEHRHTREQASLFDVSHMGQVRVDLAAAEALERLMPVDVMGLTAGQQRYALFTNARGGILDDLMATHAGDHFFVVVNAACKAQDVELLREGVGATQMEVLPDKALLALQGPAAAAVMKRLGPAATELRFMNACRARIADAECFVTRSGYTGEDGFEISVAAADAESLGRALLQQPEVEAAGLGARDSLRLEAGLCLYGHDLDADTTPIEASLLWAISKVRRPGGERAGGYPGAERVAEQIRDGTARRRVGLVPEGRAPVREGAELLDSAGARIGVVTSGCFGPSYGGPVAMGYVATEHAKLGTDLAALVRGKPLTVKVAKMPFVPQRYYRG